MKPSLREAAQALIDAVHVKDNPVVVWRSDPPAFVAKLNALRAALAEPEDDAEALRNELAHARDEIGKLVSMRVEDDKTFADLRAEVARLKGSEHRCGHAELLVQHHVRRADDAEAAVRCLSRMVSR